MEQRDEARRPQPRERRLELQRLVDRLADELLDNRFAPRPQRALPEPAAETLHPRDPDAAQLAGVAVEYMQAAIDENLAHFVGLARLQIVIAQHGRRRNPQRRQL